MSLSWRDVGMTTSILEGDEDKYGRVRTMASVRLVFGEWLAVKWTGHVLGRFKTEDEAKAVVTVIVRMEEADDPRRA